MLNGTGASFYCSPYGKNKEELQPPFENIRTNSSLNGFLTPTKELKCGGDYVNRTGIYSNLDEVLVKSQWKSGWVIPSCQKSSKKSLCTVYKIKFCIWEIPSLPESNHVLCEIAQSFWSQASVTVSKYFQESIIRTIPYWFFQLLCHFLFTSATFRYTVNNSEIVKLPVLKWTEPCKLVALVLFNSSSDSSMKYCNILLGKIRSFYKLEDIFFHRSISLHNQLTVLIFSLFIIKKVYCNI